MTKAPYKTKQMTEILTFLKSVQGRHVTVNEICDFFREKGISVGTTTIYRHLEKMVKEGLAAKYVVDGSSSACFEYIGDHGEEHENCYHCKCEKCGKLIHLQCNEVESLNSICSSIMIFRWIRIVPCFTESAVNAVRKNR